MTSRARLGSSLHFSSWIRKQGCNIRLPLCTRLNVMTLPPQGWPAKDKHHKLFPSLCVTLSSWNRNIMASNAKRPECRWVQEIGKQPDSNSTALCHQVCAEKKASIQCITLVLKRQTQQEGEKRSLKPEASTMFSIKKNHSKALNVQREENC